MPRIVEKIFALWCFDVLRYWLIIFEIASLALGQSYAFTSASKDTLIIRVNKSYHESNTSTTDNINKTNKQYDNKRDIDGLVQDYSNSSALAMELLQSCVKPSIYFIFRSANQIGMESTAALTVHWLAVDVYSFIMSTHGTIWDIISLLIAIVILPSDQRLGCWSPDNDRPPCK